MKNKKTFFVGLTATSLFLSSTPIAFAQEMVEVDPETMVDENSLNIEINSINFPDPRLLTAIKTQNPAALMAADVKALNLENLEIESLEGLQYLTNLETLSLVGTEKVNVLDLSTNTALMQLVVSENKVLNSITLPTTESLKDLTVTENKALNQIDLSVAPSLENVNLSGNSLKELNLSENHDIQTLNLAENELYRLDATPCEKLTSLILDSNNIYELKTPYTLQALLASHNKLQEFDGSNLKELTQLNLSHNMLKSISLPEEPTFTLLDLGYNHLSTLNLSRVKLVEENTPEEEIININPQYLYTNSLGNTSSTSKPNISSGGSNTPSTPDPEPVNPPEEDTKTSINGATIVLTPNSYIYTGSAIEPSVTVTVDGKPLVKDTDYEVSYDNNTNAGTGTVTIEGKGNYTGTITKFFTIRAAEITDVSDVNDSYVFKGDSIEPEVTVTVDGKALAKGKDYTVSYSNNINVGNGTVTIEGKGNYTGTITKSFTIRAAQITNISGVNDSYILDGDKCEPVVTVTVGGKTLNKDTDYEVTYTHSNKAGTATVTVTGTGNYTGSVSQNYTIKNSESVNPPEDTNTSINGATIVLAPNSYTYTGNANEPNATVTVGGKTLIKDTDYEVSYANNTNAGTGTVTIEGKGNYTGTITKSFIIRAAQITNISGVNDSYILDGDKCEPVVTVTVGGKTLNKDTDYEVTYTHSNKAGTATVTVTGTGNYTGSVSQNYTINNPEPDTITIEEVLYLKKNPQQRDSNTPIAVKFKNGEEWILLDGADVIIEEDGDTATVKSLGTTRLPIEDGKPSSLNPEVSIKAVGVDYVLGENNTFLLVANHGDDSKPVKVVMYSDNHNGLIATSNINLPEYSISNLGWELTGSESQSMLQVGNINDFNISKITDDNKTVSLFFNPDSSKVEDSILKVDVGSGEITYALIPSSNTVNVLIGTPVEVNQNNFRVLYPEEETFLSSYTIQVTSNNDELYPKDSTTPILWTILQTNKTEPTEAVFTISASNTSNIGEDNKETATIKFQYSDKLPPQYTKSQNTNESLVVKAVGLPSLAEENITASYDKSEGELSLSSLSIFIKGEYNSIKKQYEEIRLQPDEKAQIFELKKTSEENQVILKVKDPTNLINGNYFSGPNQPYYVEKDAEFTISLDDIDENEKVELDLEPIATSEKSQTVATSSYFNYPTGASNNSKAATMKVYKVEGDLMNRLYNPNSGEHFYTKDNRERDILLSLGWQDEGIGWVAPAGMPNTAPVYRLYNSIIGDHLYTLDVNEKDTLVRSGWNYEGIAWYSARQYNNFILSTNYNEPIDGIEVFRGYNPNAQDVGSHHYTINEAEKSTLVSMGWNDEGVAWWALK